MRWLLFLMALLIWRPVYGGYISLSSLDWSPRGDLWLFVQRGDVYVVTPGGADLRRLTDEGTVRWARFTPDGNGFYYSALKGTHYVLKRLPLAGGEPEVILELEDADVDYPAPSPDGSGVAFVSDLGGQCDIWFLKFGDNELIRLTDTPGREAAPDFSRDGKYLTFCGLWDGSWDIFVLELESGDLIQLTEDTFFDWSPRFSPDGKWIAFESHRSGESEIWVIRVNGLEFTRITLDPWRDTFPAWSPDGSKIAYASRRDGDRDWVIVAEGTY